jgi:hypothetical protein
MLCLLDADVMVPEMFSQLATGLFSALISLIDSSACELKSPLNLLYTCDSVFRMESFIRQPACELYFTKCSTEANCTRILSQTLLSVTLADTQTPLLPVQMSVLVSSAALVLFPLSLEKGRIVHWRRSLLSLSVRLAYSTLGPSQR